ncbi:hypothetical protein JCM8547_009287 [Rhodosporidiobolus lusitaniae]
MPPFSLGSPSHVRNESIGSYDLEEAAPLSGSNHRSSASMDSDAFSPSRRRSARRPSSPLFRLPGALYLYERRWTAYALVIGLLLGQVRWRWADEEIVASKSIALAAAARGGDVRQGVWEVYGMHDVAPVGTKPERPRALPDCQRTLLFDWGRFEYGFGSTAVTVVQAGHFAKILNYTMLFSRGNNSYGAYLDLFTPSPLTCWPREELYDPDYYLHPRPGVTTKHAYHIIDRIQKSEELRAEEVQHVIVNMEDIHWLNWYARNGTFDLPMLDSLPSLSAVQVLPATSVIPDLFKQRFFQYSAIAKEHFTLNSLLRARVSGMVRKFELDEEERKVPTVGVHFRGGDKLKMECRTTSQLSCGNITLHCETALDTLPTLSPSFPSFDLSTLSPKPRLLLMTAEPDALARFKKDKLCRKFDILPLSQGGTGKSFNQTEWIEGRSPEEKLEDSRARHLFLLPTHLFVLNLTCLPCTATHLGIRPPH